MERRIFLDRDRRRLERAADHYLRMCYRMQTAARVTEFAAFLGYTQPYLTRRVAALTGMKVGDFLRQRQLPYGAYLLKAAPNRSIKDVAIASAFGTASTFHRVFKAAYGISPAQYRVREVMKYDNAKKSEPPPGFAWIPPRKVMKYE